MNIELEQLIKFINQEHKDISISGAYELFFNYLKTYRRNETYKYHLHYYQTTLKFYDLNHIEYVSQITNDLIIKYIKYLKMLDNKNTTINKKIASIKYMINFLEKNEIIDKKNIIFNKLESDEERFKTITDKEISKILKVINSYDREKKLIILLIMKTGIRRNEAINIKLNDIDLNNNLINLSFTKNRKSRNIYLTQDIKELIIKQMKNKEIYLFERNNKKAESFIITNIFKKLKQDTNIHVSPHILRHTYATKLFDNNIDLESIRLLLGHTDYSQLKKYIHIKEKRLADISTNLKYE